MSRAWPACLLLCARFLLATGVFALFVSPVFASQISRSEALDPPAAPTNALISWIASSVVADCIGPSQNGVAWYQAGFSEAGWTAVTLMDQWSGNPGDRFYRGHFQWTPGRMKLFLPFKSDDGIDLYCNGVSLGHFGPACHQAGCVNNPGNCSINYSVPALDLTSLLVNGDNLVAAHVSNGTGSGRFFATDSTAAMQFRVSGIISNANGIGLASASLEIRSGTLVLATAVSDQDGAFSMIAVTGTYTFTAAAAGHAPASIPLSVPEDTTVSVSLVSLSDGAWAALQPAGTPPSARYKHSLIGDASRNRLVLFGGYDGAPRNDTWGLSLDGTGAWSSLAPSGSLPTARNDHTAIHDPVRDRMIVFGGINGTNRRNDTWALPFSGTLAWTQLAPTGSPPATRCEHTAVYDPTRDRMVVFGGVTGSTSSNDVWALSLGGTPAWTQLFPTGTKPAPRSAHLAFYDQTRDRMIVIGGLLNGTTDACDVWALNFSGVPTWTQLSPTGATPPGREAASAVYDLPNDRVLIFGGRSSGSRLADTWSLSLVGSGGWSQLAPGGGLPAARYDAAATYDPALSRLILVGGNGPTSFLNDTASLSWLPPAAPTALAATFEACADHVHLAWQDNAAGEDGFQVEGKVATDPYEHWLLEGVFGPNAQSADLIASALARGVSMTFRVRAFRGSDFSSYSNLSSAYITAGSNSVPPTAAFTVKSVGDARGLNIHVSLPGTATWGAAGITGIVVSRALDPSFVASLDSIGLSPYSSLNHEAVLSFPNSETDRTYYFRVRLSDACGRSSLSDIEPGTARQAPVLFVHGIWGSASSWGSAWTNELLERGYQSNRYHKMTFPTCGASWQTWGDQLQDTVSTYLAPGGPWQHDEHLDIVAHSQGGLAARRFIEQLDGQTRVRTLVMLATPNHGGRFVAVAHSAREQFDGFLPIVCDVLSEGVEDLDANAPSLRELNFGSTTTKDVICGTGPTETALPAPSAVTYYTIAGTGPAIYSCIPPFNLRLHCRHNSANHIDDIGECAGDGVVPWQSVRLRSLAPENQWLDTDITGCPGLTHIDFIAYPLAGSVGILASPVIASFVLDRLERVPIAAPSHSLTRASESADDIDSLALVRVVYDSLPPGTSQSYSAPVEACSSLTAYVASDDSLLDLALISPTGTEYDPADTTTVSGLQYERSALVGYSAIALDSPAPGTWTLRVTRTAGATAEPITLEWIVGGAAVQAAATLSSLVAVPGESLAVSAHITGVSVAESVAITAAVTDPDGSSILIGLHDDGIGPDSVAADDSFGARFAAPALNGVCSVLVTVHTADGVERVVPLSLTVILRPDLSITGMTASPAVATVQGAATVMATVRNTGLALADSVRLTLADSSTADLVGFRTVTVAPGESLSVSFPWTPQVPGEHTLSLSAALLGAAETSVDDNSAELMVAVTVNGAGPTGLADEALPRELWLSPPWPNPTSKALAFEIDLPSTQHVRLDAFDVAGRHVATIVDGELPPGRHVRSWGGTDGRNSRIPAGLYFLRLSAGSVRVSRRAILLR